ncbi:glucose-6-phosphate dehydrogenase assembly protein OpcA [Synoicihabitans lomoniglobus]|uniref:Glucose-6-phosphate dehydrogenase assembly protein OpcA n=1 Tax=Synoicihabitans lomoniglobus TaxID=2909285 RepID=A0AAF0CRD8_9BACT|nr:glucose-6-phosphate dehydrogenase assembly protein OpcA [Opitutaceae bacterium LMO-M01]WED66692.1 glucose-6-phosphate dehydrogenase assembly protein OpcA [Opitutaceae bacterium LMO-M01]
MPAVFEQLPGIEVPVGEIKQSLARLWHDATHGGDAVPAPNEVRAMQMNFVLHFGFATTPPEALSEFDTIKAFAQRYPCRVVVLCPLNEDNAGVEMRAKVYGECFLGKSKSDTRCVEFVMLCYPMASRQFLENQVSICLSTDLPLYYWAHRFSDSGRLADYQFMLQHAKRVIFDTALVPADAMTYPWPKPKAIRDLVHSRLLPVRQLLGQFLSGFPPDKLVAGLQQVRLYHRAKYAPEARVLWAWLRNRLCACGAADDIDGVIKPSEAVGIDDFAVEFRYDSANYFKWRAAIGKNHAEFAADLGNGRVDLTTAMHLLDPPAALAEAVFF